MNEIILLYKIIIYQENIISGKEMFKSKTKRLIAYLMVFFSIFVKIEIVRLNIVEINIKITN